MFFIKNISIHKLFINLQSQWLSSLMDRTSGFGPEGWGFESSLSHKKTSTIFISCLFFYTNEKTVDYINYQ